jgi:hypothetical protein
MAIAAESIPCRILRQLGGIERECNAYCFIFREVAGSKLLEEQQSVAVTGWARGTFGGRVTSPCGTEIQPSKPSIRRHQTKGAFHMILHRTPEFFL